MEPTGFFVICSGQGEAEPAPTAPTPGAPPAAAVPPSRYSFRLGWSEGAPYIADWGSADRILVNSAPIEPYKPCVLGARDQITLGDTQLCWMPASDRATLVLSREEAETALAGRAAPPAIAAGGGDRAATGEADKTAPAMPAPRPAGVQAAEAAEATWPGVPEELTVPPEVSQKPARVQPAAEGVGAAQQAAPQSRAAALDATVVLQKGAVRPPPEPPKAAAQVPAIPAARSEAESAQETAWADMAKLLDENADVTFAPTPAGRGAQAAHLVIYMGDRTWQAGLEKERMTVGRGEENDIVIPDSFVSRQHASIERRGDAYVIRETQSRNGVWLGKQRIQEHMLRDGDVLALGGARLVFKGQFSSDELTLIGPPRIDGERKRRPVVVVPGLMGSELWLGSERLWPNPRYILSNPDLFRLPGDPRIEARHIVSEVVIVPNIVKQRQYSALGDYLVAGLGYTRGRDLMEFAYDWRQDVRVAAQRLGEAIEKWEVDPPVTIIAHSLGTLVTRYYVERLGGKQVVERIILMGGPHHGTPKGLAAILVGPGMLPFGVGAERMRGVLSTFPSAYQILPIYPCIIDQDGTYIDALEDRSWLPEPQRPHLRAARSFRRELGEVSSVPAVSIFGYGFKTMLHVKIKRRPDGQWQGAEFVDDTAGDLSVPSGSAVLKGSEIHPVCQEHGALYVDDDVRMRLKVELTRSTTWQKRKY